MINQRYIYVGDYDHRINKEDDNHKKFPHGIHRLTIDPIKRCITYDKTYENVDNPSFLLIDGEQKHLYAANETAKFDGMNGGSISVFAINQENGDLEFLQQIATQGAHPCHLSISPDGGYLVATNYSGGTVMCYNIRSDGTLEKNELLVHQGNSINKERQGEPHPHSTLFIRNENTFLALDLGMDQLLAYDIEGNGAIHKNREKTIKARPGVGPRHSVYHPNLEVIYVVNELSSTVSVLEYSNLDGAFHQIQSISMLGYLPGKTGVKRETAKLHVEDESSVLYDDISMIESTGADIHISKNGKYLYASNRGEDSIVCYLVNQEDGTLSPCRSTSSGGQSPRNFMIDPLEEYIIVANQGSDLVVLFELNKETGELTELQKLDIPKPVCVIPLIL